MQPKAWQEYMAARLDEIADHPRFRDLLSALIDARRWEEPHYYDKMNRKQVGIDKARAAVASPTAAGYWERIALRALIMLDMSPAEREELIAKAHADFAEANSRLREQLLNPSLGQRTEEQLQQTTKLKELIASIKL